MKTYPRIAALISVTFWSLGALFVLGLNRLPPCFILAFSTSISLGLAVIYLTITGRWRFIASSRKLLFPAVSLVVINQMCYVLAFRNAPAVQVDLINFLWPSMLVLLTAKFTGRYTSYLVVASGATGVFLALDPSSMNLNYLGGYVTAFMAALSWTGYSLFVRKHKLPNEFLCLNVGLGAPIYWVLHLLLREPSVSITIQEIGLLLLCGGGFYIVANLCWGYALKFGSVREASALSYLIPLLSIVALVIFGYTEFTVRIFCATILVVIAAVIPMLTDMLKGQPLLLGKNTN